MPYTNQHERTAWPARFIVACTAKSLAIFYPFTSLGFKTYGTLDQRLVHVWLPSLAVTMYTPLGKSGDPSNGATAW